MKKEYSYFKRENQYYPLIDVELFGPKENLMVKALIDSGASCSLFRPEIANYLGIPVNVGRKLYFQGIKGKIIGYLHQITVRLDNKKFNCYIAFSNELDVSFNILGRNNFFLLFLITFNEKNQRILIEENKLDKKG
jgi:hypothetical protein